MEGGRPHVLRGGEGSFFFFVTKDCFLRWCSCSLCSTHDLVKRRYQREGALWCHLWPPGRGLYSKAHIPCPFRLSLPLWPAGLPFQFHLGLPIPRATWMELQGCGSSAALCTHSSSSKAHFSAIPWPEVSIDAQGRAPTVSSRKDFLELWREAKRLCPHVSAWSVPSPAGHVTWGGALCYFWKGLSNNPTLWEITISTVDMKTKQNDIRIGIVRKLDSPSLALSGVPRR